MCQMKHFFIIFLALLPLMAWAQIPTVDPVGTYTTVNEKGEEETGTVVMGQVFNNTFHIVFTANPTIPDGYKSQVWYEWTMWKEKEPEKIILRRNDETFEYDFNEYGTYVVQLKAIFYGEEGVEDYEFPQEGEDAKLISFSLSESFLDFPNAFSPNNDDHNNFLKPKDGFKGIVKFHAVVFNRWGKKLYSWDDVHGSWDGKVNGKFVKDGVYFLHVNAKGSDGRDFNIKKAINVLTGYNNGENEGGGSEE